MTAVSRGTGRRLGRGRDPAVPPSRDKNRPLAGEQAPGVRESQRAGERQGEAQPSASNLNEQIPGQTALELRHMQPTLWSL